MNPQRKNTDSPFVFIVDHCFKNNKDLTNSLPLSKNDLILFADTTHEPKTKQGDSIRDRLKSAFGDNISGVIGVGGGSVMDIAKAVAPNADQQGFIHKLSGMGFDPKSCPL